MLEERPSILVVVTLQTDHPYRQLALVVCYQNYIYIQIYVPCACNV